MSSTAPPMRPSTATMANGTRNQVGSRMASAPIGSLAIEVLSAFEEPASSSPKMSRTIGATAPPKVVQPATPALEDLRGR